MGGARPCCQAGDARVIAADVEQTDEPTYFVVMSGGYMPLFVHRKLQSAIDWMGRRTRRLVEAGHAAAHDRTMTIIAVITEPP